MIFFKHEPARWLTNLWAVFLVLISVQVGPARAAEPAGSVVVVTGAVSAVDTEGQVRILDKGSAVFAGDRLTTASKSLCVLKMADGAKLVLREESEMEIEDYKFEDSEEDSSTMELIKGGFRAITGAIGNQNPDAYKVRSDLSVIGIRGTEYLTRLCVVTAEGNPCERDLVELGGERGGVPEGQYLFVTTGDMYMLKQIDGEAVDVIDVSAGQVALATEDEVKLLPEAPDFLSEDPTPSPGGVREDATPLSDFPGCRI